MARFRFEMNQTLSLTIALLTLVDCCLQIKNGQEYHKILFLILQSSRLVVTLIYLFVVLVTPFPVKSNVSLTVLFTLVTIVVAMLLCTIQPFHKQVLSLTLHLIMICIASQEVMDKMFVLFAESRFCMMFQANQLPLSTLYTVCLAIVVGTILRASNGNNAPTAAVWTERQLMYLGFMGQLFMRMLKCLILPLIFSSLVYAIGNLDSRLSGRIAVRTLSYYLTTTVLAILVGLTLVNIVQPGGRVQRKQVSQMAVSSGLSKHLTTTDSLLDLFRLSSNFFVTFFS